MLFPISPSPNPVKASNNLHIRMAVAAVLLCMAASSNAQSRVTFTGAGIRRVELTDTFLIRQLRRIIRYQEQTDTLFAKGYGYLMLNPYNRGEPGPIIYGEPETELIDTVMAFHCSASFMAPDVAETYQFDIRPPYYTHVDKRLVLIEQSGSHIEYTPAALRRLRRIMAPFLEKPGRKMQMEGGKPVDVTDLKSRDRFKFWEQFSIYYTKDPRGDGSYLPPSVVRSYYMVVSPF